MIMWILYLVPLLILGFFAKDNLSKEIKNWLVIGETHVPRVETGSIEVAFSPDQGATKAIVKAIGEAQETVLVSAYSFTSKEIATALLNAKKRGVVVKIILDKSQVSQKYSASTFFSNQGFDLRIDVKHAIFHNKVMIIDDGTVVTGSFNFTKAAESRNAENVLIIRRNPALKKIYEQDFIKHWHQSMPHAEYRNTKLRE